VSSRGVGLFGQVERRHHGVILAAHVEATSELARRALGDRQTAPPSISGPARPV
jgi:hypothetical protein